ncbi:MAG: TIGR04255 family protein [Sedimentisphaerales bacterium]
MPEEKRKLPEYDNPPVTEVVIGVQFKALEAFTAVHPGLYWQRIRNNYPKFSAKPPLGTTFEFFSGDKLPTFKPKDSQIPPIPRCWLLDDSENRLIQIQSERFLHNWKKVTGEEDYPRFNNICKDFKTLWIDFIDFSKDEGLGQVEPNQWEVTYVNYIFENMGWASMNDLCHLFPSWSGKSSEGYLPIPENIVINTTYAFPEQLGRLHITLEPSYKMPDSIKLLRLNLTARGRLESSDIETLMTSLEQGHEWIVRGFTDFTSPEAHKMWKRKEEVNHA